MSISSKALMITGIDDRRYWNYIPTEESRCIFLFFSSIIIFLNSHELFLYSQKTMHTAYTVIHSSQIDALTSQYYVPCCIEGTVILGYF